MTVPTLPTVPGNDPPPRPGGRRSRDPHAGEAALPEALVGVWRTVATGEAAERSIWLVTRGRFAVVHINGGAVHAAAGRVWWSSPAVVWEYAVSTRPRQSGEERSVFERLDEVTYDVTTLCGSSAAVRHDRRVRLAGADASRVALSRPRTRVVRVDDHAIVVGSRTAYYWVRAAGRWEMRERAGGSSSVLDAPPPQPSPRHATRGEIVWCGLRWRVDEVRRG